MLGIFKELLREKNEKSQLGNIVLKPDMTKQIPFFEECKDKEKGFLRIICQIRMVQLG